MKPAAQKAMTMLSKTPMLAIVIVVFVLGYTFKGMVSTAPRPASTGAVEEASEIRGQGHGLVSGKDSADVQSWSRRL